MFENRAYRKVYPTPRPLPPSVLPLSGGRKPRSIREGARQPKARYFIRAFARSCRRGRDFINASPFPIAMGKGRGWGRKGAAGQNLPLSG